MYKNVKTFIQQLRIYSLFDRCYWQNIFIIQMIYFQHFCSGTISHLAEISEAQQSSTDWISPCGDAVQWHAVKNLCKSQFWGVGEAAWSIFIFTLIDTDFRNKQEFDEIASQIKKVWSRADVLKQYLIWTAKKPYLQTQTWGQNTKMLHWHDENMITSLKTSEMCGRGDVRGPVRFWTAAASPGPTRRLIVSSIQWATADGKVAFGSRGCLGRIHQTKSRLWHWS